MIVVCTTGFTAEERIIIQSLISSDLQNFIVVDDSLKSGRTNVLVCRLAGTTKYVQALAHGIPCVRYSWLVDTARLRCAQPYDRDEYRVLCFLGMSVCVAGGTQQQRDHVRRLCEIHGATFSPTLTKHTHFLVTLGDSQHSDKLPFAHKNQIRMGDLDWFLKCVDQSEWVDPIDGPKGPGDSIIPPPVVSPPILAGVVVYFLNDSLNPLVPQHLHSALLATGPRHVTQLSPRVTHIVVLCEWSRIPQKTKLIVGSHVKLTRARVVSCKWLEICAQRKCRVSESLYEISVATDVFVITTAGIKGGMKDELSSFVVSLGGVMQPTLVLKDIGGTSGLHPTTHLVISRASTLENCEKLKKAMSAAQNEEERVKIVYVDWLVRCRASQQWLPVLSNEFVGIDDVTFNPIVSNLVQQMDQQAAVVEINDSTGVHEAKRICRRDMAQHQQQHPTTPTALRGRESQ
eukprot:PhF_6_TR22557/c0_g1_i3/m.32087